jgi:hypothetical protein
MVVTSYPLRAILHNSNAMGNIAKWAVELARFQLDFQPRHAIKNQVLADFVAEWTPAPSIPRGPDHGSEPLPPEVRASVFTGPHWTLLFNGSARNKKVGASDNFLPEDQASAERIVRLAKRYAVVEGDCDTLGVKFVSH